MALKVINAEFFRYGAEARERFVREARAAASLHHRHVASIYQFGIDEETGQRFYAMEFIEGETLEERVRRTGPLNVGAVVEIARQITCALVVAEKHGVVHRDLKPGNVMITTSEDSDKAEVKIIDFGLAKALATRKPARPDRWRISRHAGFRQPRATRPLSGRCPFRHLLAGATLWYLLTGQLPFGEVCMAAARRPLRAAHVPASFSSLLVSMLATEPAVRPTAKEIAAKLEALSRRRLRIIPASQRPSVVALALAFFFHPPPSGPPLHGRFDLPAQEHRRAPL